MTFALFKVRKDIPKTTSGLILPTRKVSSKNRTWLALSVIEKAMTTIPKLSSMVPLIFCALISIGLMGSPSSQARVGWIVLTSLLKSKSANIDTDFFWNVMGYRIHGICIRFKYPLLLSLPSLPTLAVSTALAVPTASSLVPVTGIEVAKTNNSFLTPSLDLNLEDICLSNVPSNGRWSIWLGRYLSLFSWRHWRQHSLQGSCGHNPISVLRGAGNFVGGLGPSLGWRKKSAEWKIIVSH